jgi:hypothetical protein
VFNTHDPSLKTDPPKPIFNDDTDAVIADSGNEEIVQGKMEKSIDATATTPPPEDSAAVEDFLEDEEGIDALLASADEDFGDLDLADFDDDDDLEDLENMLRS